ncbi:tyrosine-protein phosphatase [Streptomyces sp. WAC01280]|uniref:tyrosine-protein phosphatase n=1 Tax=Streptomyces sp. WAC01280 TaxID=2487424 RepID=UPI000F779037|nr:tyrosine-protein phosphatase [Streptomyces sp. WAC01280]RSS51988.1 tyrosine-protein phosphatase [Streptomyces sp. WAC01280]
MPLSRRALLTTTGATALFAALPANARAHARPTAPRTTIRQIPLQGAVNVRDLGGYRTYDGGRVRHGLAYRGDHLGKLTAADITTLAGLGLGTVVDLRIPLEVGYDGADRLPAGVVPVARPITDNGLFGRLMAAIGSRDPVRQEEMLGGGRAAAFMSDVYRTFVTEPANRAAFAENLRDLGDPARGPLLFHCTSGKDRTGWTGYLLLTLLGVPTATARADYLASNTFRAAYDAQVREGLRQGGFMQNPDLIVPLQEVRPEYLDTALDQVRASYGSLLRYCSVGLGLEFREVLALRERLVLGA